MTRFPVALLSGSMVENDTPRGGEALKATVTGQKAADTTCATVETSKVAAAPSGVTSTLRVLPLTTVKNDEPTPARVIRLSLSRLLPAPSDSASLSRLPGTERFG